ncbi:hypothetical protein RhiJN_20728 [Ceratobasidium sp. AG-Ba]|nr:hypothetical protein RhiJN_20727 [Ceratobasidium sp. AG-Ba]QRV92710.1 hypothetical protein RhiJN_20728 [Ceratobasidium sp. AG-Ba]
MHFSTTCIALVATAAAFVVGSPVENLSKRETSYGNPDLVTDQGNRFKLNFGSTSGHPNACPGHYICYIPRNGAQHGDVSLGNPDDFVDEGNRWRLNYGSTSGHPNACDGHYICYIYK